MKRLKIDVQPPFSDEPKSSFLTVPDECFAKVGVDGFKRAQTAAYESLGATVLSVTLVQELHLEL